MMDIADREELEKAGYNSNLYYCGNYSGQRFYSYIYNFLRKRGVRFAFNRACFIHDIRYTKEFNFKTKMAIDLEFFLNMQKCIAHHYETEELSATQRGYLHIVACAFYGLVVLATPFYLRKEKRNKKL